MDDLANWRSVGLRKSMFLQIVGKENDLDICILNYKLAQVYSSRGWVGPIWCHTSSKRRCMVEPRSTAPVPNLLSTRALDCGERREAVGHLSMWETLHLENKLQALEPTINILDEQEFPSMCERPQFSMPSIASRLASTPTMPRWSACHTGKHATTAASPRLGAECVSELQPCSSKTKIRIMPHPSSMHLTNWWITPNLLLVYFPPLPNVIKLLSSFREKSHIRDNVLISCSNAPSPAPPPHLSSLLSEVIQHLKSSTCLLDPIPTKLFRSFITS